MNPKPLNTFIRAVFVISVLLIVILLQRCPGKEVVYVRPHIDTKPIWSAINKKAAEIAFLKELGVPKEKELVKRVKNYTDLKPKLTRMPCDSALTQVVSACDSIVSESDSLISNLKVIISQYDTLVSKLNTLRTDDSTNHRITIDSLVVMNNAIAPRQMFYLGVDVNTSKQVFISAGFDTKKAAFFGGYDPFNKQIRAGAYVKIKAWNRR